MDLSKIPFEASPNFRKGRLGKVKYIILHCPVGSFSSCKNTFKNPANGVSAHYVVSQKGEVVQMVNLVDTAWHCYGFNSSSVGIEMEDKMQVEKSAVWQTKELMEATANLVAALLKKYNLSIESVVGHNAKFIQDYARKNRPSMIHTDPGKFFSLVDFRNKVQRLINDGI